MVAEDLVMRGDIEADPLGVNPLMRPPGQALHADAGCRVTDTASFIYASSKQTLDWPNLWR